MFGDDDLGARVRAARQYANLSQTALADRLGKDRRSLARIEDDEDSERELTVPEAKAIAEATGVPVGFLIDGWIAPPELERRVAALEQAVSRQAATEHSRARLDDALRRFEARTRNPGSEQPGERQGAADGERDIG